MKPAQAIRICALLVVIFVAGLVTGRLTAPKSPPMMTMADGRIVTSDYPMVRLRRSLNLTADQEAQFAALFEEMTREMSRIPPGTRERMAKFKGYVPRMRALLRSDQQPAFEAYVRDTEERFERMLSRRRLRNGGPR